MQFHLLLLLMWLSLFCVSGNRRIPNFSLCKINSQRSQSIPNVCGEIRFWCFQLLILVYCLVAIVCIQHEEQIKSRRKNNNKRIKVSFTTRLFFIHYQSTQYIIGNRLNRVETKSDRFTHTRASLYSLLN